MKWWNDDLQLGWVSSTPFGLPEWLLFLSQHSVILQSIWFIIWVANRTSSELTKLKCKWTRKWKGKGKGEGETPLGMCNFLKCTSD